jgi:hypothetical protein
VVGGRDYGLRDPRDSVESEANLPPQCLPHDRSLSVIGLG